MKRLNNKGMTIVEILVTFVLVGIIVISMYTSISNLKSRQTISQYKERIITYRDLLTRDIQNDLIMKQLVSVTSNENIYTFTFKDGSSKNLSINKNTSNETSDKLCDNPTSQHIESISYAGVEYKLPNVGSENVKIGETCKTIYSLRIGDVSIDTTNNILLLKIELMHPDLGNKYSINIVSPINYQ